MDFKNTKQTRLDRSLTRLAEGYGKILARVLVILFIVEFVEQIVILTDFNEILAIFLMGLGIGAVIIEGIVRAWMDKKEKENK